MANTFTTIQVKRSSTLSTPVSLANGEFGYSFVSNTLFVGGPTGIPIPIASNTEFAISDMANTGLTNIAANGVVTTVNTRMINFNNTATMNIATVANGTGTDVAWSANLSAIASGVNNFQVDILANGSVTIANANVNFNNTATVNVAVTANSPGQGNIAFNVNTSAITNVISLNVSSNISNVGNIAVSQNLTTGNANVVGISMNVKQNLFYGNATAVQNTSTGNLSVTTLANVATLNASSSAALNSGLFTVGLTANSANAANILNVAVQVFAANATVNAISFIPSWTSATVNNSGTSASGQNCFTGTITGQDTAGFWIDPFQIVHLRGSLANSGAGNIAAYAGSPAMNSNIANNFPVPTTNVFVTATARCNGNGVLNVCTVLLAIYNNNAMQMINVAFANGQPASQTLSWNIANVSLYGITYSRV